MHTMKSYDHLSAKLTLITVFIPFTPKARSCQYLEAFFFLSTSIRHSMHIDYFKEKAHFFTMNGYTIKEKNSIIFASLLGEDKLLYEKHLLDSFKIDPVFKGLSCP